MAEFDRDKLIAELGVDDVVSANFAMHSLRDFLLTLLVEDLAPPIHSWVRLQLDHWNKVAESGVLIDEAFQSELKFLDPLEQVIFAAAVHPDNEPLLGPMQSRLITSLIVRLRSGVAMNEHDRHAADWLLDVLKLKPEPPVE